jgi:drug/metabolite transporter (DMT)-like permease
MTSANHRPGIAAPAASPAPPQADNPLRGIVLSIVATMFFAVSDTMAKYLTSSLPVIEIAWIRYVIFAGFGAVLVRHAHQRSVRPRNISLQVVRGLGLVGSAVLFVFGTSRMPMAEATSISFIAPLLVTVLAIPILGEVVGIRRWSAVLAGMAGVLVVVRPGFAGFQPAAGFGVASSCCWATALIITRKMAGSERPATTLLWSAVVGLLVLTLLLPLVAVWPSGRQLALAVTLGMLASVGQWLVILAYRLAPASLLAPFTYGQLLWSTACGYVVFGNVPDHWTLLGAAIIVASGLYTARRERARVGRVAVGTAAAPVVADAAARVPDRRGPDRRGGV